MESAVSTVYLLLGALVALLLFATQFQPLSRSKFTQFTPTVQRTQDRDTEFLHAPSFFAKSHNFTINGGCFYALSKGSSQAHADITSVFQIIPKHKIQTISVISIRKGSRFNSAKTKNYDVLLQVFEGPKAKQMWQETVKFSRCRMNAHILDIIGISPSTSANSSSDPCYIVFNGAGTRNTHHVIASMLTEEDKKATAIGMRVVHGIASGFDYISSTDLPISKLGMDEIVFFSDDSGHTRLAFTPNALEHSTPNLKNRQLSDVEICNSFIKKIFNDANHTIHGDQVDRHSKEEFSDHMGFTPQTELHSDDSETTATMNRLQSEATIRPPRREIIWNASGFSDLPLSSLCQNYDLILNNKTVRLPRRFGPNQSIGYERNCNCVGYIREEITLTPDAFRNAVFIYQQPSPNERCSMCGELLWKLSEVNEGVPRAEIFFEGFQSHSMTDLVSPRQTLVKYLQDSKPIELEHIEAIHRKNTPGFMCSACGRKFGWKSSLIRHQKSPCPILKARPGT